MTKRDIVLGGRRMIISSPRHLHNMIQPERPCIWTWNRLHERTRLEWRKEPKNG